MTTLRHIALPTKVLIVKALVFPVVIYGCESWTIKRADCWTDAFELCCWRKLLDCKRIKPVNPKGNQPWVFIGTTDAEAEAAILWSLDVKNQVIGKEPWCWERLKTGEEGGGRGLNVWMAPPIQWTWVLAGSGRWWRTGKSGVLQSMGLQRVGWDWATEQQPQLPPWKGTN